MAEVLAIVPARGGSKGIPGKNVKLLDGKPLLAYTLETALLATKITAVCVSSDSDVILRAASAFPSVYAHKRNPDIAQDTSPITEAIEDVLNHYERKGRIFELIVLLQPTAPIREPFHIDEAVDALNQTPHANALISVCEMKDVHPARMYRVKGGLLTSFFPEFETAMRQDIPPAFYRNGSIYIVRTVAFKEQQMLMAKPTIPFIMPNEYLANIDEPIDWIIAEALVKHWKSIRK